jgi:hypothetical protein
MYNCTCLVCLENVGVFKRHFEQVLYTTVVLSDSYILSRPFCFAKKTSRLELKNFLCYFYFHHWKAHRGTRRRSVTILKAHVYVAL